jgi:hypothetical protein
MARAFKFSVGDRVVYHARVAGNGFLDGEHGTVIYVDNTSTPYTVEFDRPLAGGITDERAQRPGFTPKPWRGWFCQEENLEPEP